MIRPALLLGLGVAAGPAIAQPQPPQSPFVIDRNRADRAQPIAPAPRGTPPRTSADALAAVEGESAGTIIRGIAFERPAPTPVAEAARGFVGKPADKATLAALAKALSDAYARSDIALYTVLIPAQDFAQGQVHILNLEGFVEGVQVSGKAPARQRTLIAAIGARLRAEAPLSRRALERYISLMRDVPGALLDVDIVRGSRPGAVRVTVVARQKKPTVTFAYDSRATRGFGHGTVQAVATGYGLLRPGDQTDLTLAASGNLKGYRFASLAHATPLGTDGTRLGLNAGYLRTRPKTSAIDGDAKLAGITVSHPLIRGYRENLTASVSLDGIDSDNAAFGALIASERTRAVRFALGWSDAGPKTVLAGGLTVTRGLDILGARVIAPFAETGFTKLNARASADRAIGKQVVARVRASGQFSQDRLPAVERFAVGGPDYGRAFEAAVISADKGVAGSAELAWRPLKAGPIAASELYTFIDGARLGIRPRGGFAGANYDLASAGGGLRFAYGTKAAVSLEAAHTVDRPFAGYPSDWQLSVGWRLALR